MYGDRLSSLNDIRAVYDFDEFVKHYRPRQADSGIQDHYALDFEIRENNNVYVRSKKAINAKERWSTWVRLYPSLLDPRGRHTHHSPSVVPPVLKNKEWEEFDTRVVKKLTR